MYTYSQIKELENQILMLRGKQTPKKAIQIDDEDDDEDDDDSDDEAEIDANGINDTKKQKSMYF